jgi:hypothetical protein
VKKNLEDHCFTYGRSVIVTSSHLLHKQTSINDKSVSSNPATAPGRGMLEVAALRLVLKDQSQQHRPSATKPLKAWIESLVGPQRVFISTIADAQDPRASFLFLPIASSRHRAWRLLLGSIRLDRNDGQYASLTRANREGGQQILAILIQVTQLIFDAGNQLGQVHDAISIGAPLFAQVGRFNAEVFVPVKRPRPRGQVGQTYVPGRAK